MTTRDYAEAYEDDSDNVRAWTAQDAQEPASLGDVKDLARNFVELTAEVTYLRFDLDEAVAQRDEAWAVIARMTLDVEP